MFKKKKQSNVPGIVVNGQTSGSAETPKPTTGKKLTLPRLSGKRTLVLAAVLLIVGAGLAVAGLLYQRSSDKSARNTDSNSQEVSDYTAAQKASLDAGNSYNPETGEGYQDAIATLDDGLKEVSGDDEETARVYISKASVYMNAKQYQQALDMAQQAEGLDPTSVSSAYIARANAELGNKADAIKYYQLTIDRIKAFKYHNQTDIDYYQDQLDKVKAS